MPDGRNPFLFLLSGRRKHAKMKKNAAYGDFPRRGTGEMTTKGYAIRWPRMMPIQLGGQILIVLLMLVSVLSGLVSSSRWLLLFQWFVIAFMLGLTGVQGFRLLRKPTPELKLSEHGLTIRGRDIPIDQIDRILLDGYFLSSIGIKLRGRRTVPAGLHFRFAGEEDRSTNELKQWARAHEIPISPGRVVRWL